MKNSIIIVTLFFFSFSLSVVAQNVEFKASNFKDKKEEFKEVMLKMETTDLILDKANEDVVMLRNPKDQYKEALVVYLELQKFNPNSAELNMKIGNCYLNTNEKYKAEEFIDKAIKLNPEISTMLYFYLGQVNQINYEWSEAIKNYTKFEEGTKSKLAEHYKKITSKYKKECKSGKKLHKEPVKAWVDNVKAVNSPRDDYSPCLSADGELLMFTSRRDNGRAINALGEFDSDIYRSTKVKRKWSQAKNVGIPLSTPKDETGSALAYDGQRLLMFKEENGNTDIYESTLDGVLWSEPIRKLSKVPNTEHNETFATYEPQDIKVYYIYDGMTRGDKEIFITGLMVYTVADYNKWGKGQSLGQPVTTRYNEGSVYVHPDGKTMYFSSQGHNSMGGYDIFYSTKNNLEQWTKPVNLGYPINTPYDDLFYASTANGKYAYIASNRNGGEGGLDIYKVTYWGAPKQMMVGSEDFLLASVAEPILDVHIEESVEVDKKSLTVFKGKIIDAISRKPLKAELEIIDNKTAKLFSKMNSNSATGKFLMSLPSGKNYGIAVKREGYLFHSENFDIPAKSDYNLVEKTIELKNIAIGSKIALRNVFFEVGKSNMNPLSNPELARLVKLLNDVPRLKIELSGHTDNTGSEELNLKLSSARAQVVVDHLIQEGISKDRLVAKGYGSTRPVDTNNTKDGRQNNRRTEFEIIAN